MSPFSVYSVRADEREIYRGDVDVEEELHIVQPPDSVSPMTSLNTEAILHLADVIEAAGAHFNLGFFGSLGVDGDDDNIDPVELRTMKCGTVGCVAGWQNAIDDYSPLSDTDRAAQRLGLTRGQASNLFFATRHSVWVELAPEFGWEVSDFGYDGDNDIYTKTIKNWGDIKADQAAEVLRRIAAGTVEL